MVYFIVIAAKYSDSFLILYPSAILDVILMMIVLLLGITTILITVLIMARIGRMFELLSESFLILHYIFKFIHQFTNTINSLIDDIEFTLRDICNAYKRQKIANNKQYPIIHRIGIKTTCVICLRKTRPKTRVAQLGCGHSFHTSCINEWLAINPQCPYCRQAV